jgi:hypothetical protein
MDEFTGPGTPLTQDGVDQAVAATGADVASLWSVLEVETSGCGYLSDRRPKILFERHFFHRLTDGRFDATDPDVSNPVAGGYGAPGDHQYVRLAAALQLDREAALRSASWGLGQIMGDNCVATGFDRVDDMVSSFVASENEQLLGMANFIASSALKQALATQDWTTFARLYNGPSFAKNRYDERLATAHARLTNSGPPDLNLRAAQVYLNYLGKDTGGIDGIAGPKTRQALQDFQQANNLAPGDGTLTDETLAALAAA